MLDPWEAAAQQPTAQLDPWEAAASPQSGMQKFGQDLAARVQQGKDIENSNLNPVAKTLAYVGKVGALTANDAISDAIPQSVKDLASGAANMVEHAASYLPGMQSYNNAVNQTMQGAGQAWNGVQQNYPNIAASAEGLGDVAQLAGNLASVKGGVSSLRSGVNAVSDAMPIKSAATPELTLAEQAAKDKAAAAAGYQAQADVPFSDDQLQGLQKNLQGLIPQKDASLKVWNNSPAAGHVNDLLDTINKEPLTFSGALDQRAGINDSWVSATRAGNSNQARLINQVKDALDKTMVNPETGEWQGANRQFGIAATKQDFSDMVDLADGKAQPANSLDTAINKYINSWRGDTLLPNEKSILQQITSNSFGKELKKSVAGRLTSYTAAGIGAAAGSAIPIPVLGPVLGAVSGDLLGTYASKFSRDTVMQDKIAALQDFFDELDKRPMPKFSPAPQAAAQEVPAIEGQKLLPSPNSARPMSDAEIAQSQELLKNGNIKTVGEPQNNAPMTTVRDPNTGLLYKAIKEPVGAAAQNEGYQQLSWIKQRAIDKLIPQYTSNALSRAQVLREMARIGLSPRDADQILSTAYQAKIYRK